MQLEKLDGEVIKTLLVSLRSDFVELLVSKVTLTPAHSLSCDG